MRLCVLRTQPRKHKSRGILAILVFKQSATDCYTRPLANIKKNEMIKLIPIKNNELWGFSNLKGEIIIEPKFIEVESFKEGFALVCTKKIPAKKLYISKYENDIFPNETIQNYKGSWDKIWGIINQKGEFVVESIFKSINLVSNGIAIGIKYAGPGKRYGDYCENIYHLVNFKNENYPKSAGGRYNWYSLFSNKFWFLSYGRDPVGKDYCRRHNLIVNEKGETILEISGKNIVGDFENGILKITNSNKTSFYNENGKLLAEKNTTFENISKNIDGIYFLKEGNDYFQFNIINKEIKKLDFNLDLTSPEFKSKKVIETNSSY